jgi:hypothetical protein
MKWNLGANIYTADTRTAGKEVGYRIKEFKAEVAREDNKKALSEGINSIGHIILDTLLQAVKGLKKFFAGSTAGPEITLLPQSSFLSSSKTIGRAFVDAVIPPSPRQR